MVKNAKGLLRIWIHPKRTQEADEEMIRVLNKLTIEKAEEVEMKGSKKYIRGSKGQQMMLKFLLEDIRTGQSWWTEGLLDSGCTGSCITKKFVNDSGIKMIKLSRLILVYNADGTLNQGGSIEEIVEMRMVIEDHQERI